MNKKPTDKFIILFPKPDQPDITLRELKILRKVLTLDYLLKNLPPGYNFLGLIDGAGNEFKGENLISELPSGTFTVLYQSNSIEEEEELADPADTVPNDIARACYSTLCFSSGAPLKELEKTLLSGNHDIVAAALGTVHINTNKWHYLICLTADSVVVSIDCNLFKLDFLDFKEVATFSSTCGQGNGPVHPHAHTYASLLPFNTLLALCTSISEPFDWKSVPQFSAIPNASKSSFLNADIRSSRVFSQSNLNSLREGEKPDSRYLPTRKLIFTGTSISGMVAHLAALLAREISIKEDLKVEVRSVTFDAPHCVSLNISDALLKNNFSKLHVTFFSKTDPSIMLFQLAFNVQVSRALRNDNYFDAETWLKDIKSLFRTPNSENANSVKARLQNAIDMVSMHAIETSNSRKFVPLGLFGHETSRGPLRTHLQMSDDIFAIDELIQSIELQLHRLVHPPIMNIKLFTDKAKSFTLIPPPAQLMNISAKFAPVVNQCMLLTSSNSGDGTNARTDITIVGSNLENIIQRSSNPYAVGIGWKGKSHASKSPILIHEIKSVNVEQGCSVLVIRTSMNEAKLVLTNTSFRSERVLLSIFNDFGESEIFEPSNNHTLQTPVKLQMFNNFNQDLLITAFLRSMMMMHVKQEMNAENKPKIESNEAAAVPEGGKEKLLRRQFPGALRKLFDVERLILNVDKSELEQIVSTYYDNPDGLPYACSKASKVIEKMIYTLSIPLKLEFEGFFKTILKKIAGGIGVISGGVLTVAGGILALPGVLVLLASMPAINTQDADWSMLAAIPGALLALPGIGIGAAGVWLVSRSIRAARDKPTLQYSQNLKLLLLILNGDPNTIMDEVPSLEDSVAKQYNLQVLQLKPPIEPMRRTRLWDVSDRSLDKILTDLDNQKITSNQYSSASDLSKRIIRNWMRISGKIQRIRALIESHLVIGFVGVHNAGKSSWVNSLFNLNVMADSIMRTENDSSCSEFRSSNQILLGPSKQIRLESKRSGLPGLF